MATLTDLENDLSHFLAENGLADGYWSREEKQRLLNEGIRDVQRRSLQLLKTDSLGRTVANLQFYSTPNDFWRPRRLYIDRQKYRRIGLERFEELKSDDIDIKVSGGGRGNRWYIWRAEEGKIEVLPTPTTADLEIRFVYLQKHPTLATGGTVLLDDATIHLPAFYAAWRLVYREKKNREKGQQLGMEYLEGVRSATSFLNSELDDIDEGWGLDETAFPPVDLFQNFDTADLNP